MTLLDRVPLDRITAQAREVNFRRTALSIIAGLLYAVGWLGFKVFAVAWLALCWVAVAVKVGYRDAAASNRAARQRR